MKDNFLEQLNTEQREAVEYLDGPLLVIAGAGSGKTRVLTYKIAYLLQNGMQPWEILALTFTNKAAREMRDRIGRLVGDDLARYLNMGTFHSVCSRILRLEAAKIGYTTNFTIYDETDSRSLLKNIIKDMNLNDKVYKSATVHNRISMAKNHLILAEDYAMDSSAIQRDIESRMPDVANIYQAYSARCRQANAMDFDDLLVLTYVLFRDNEDVRRRYVDRFRYVLVDEYQDTNKVQHEILWQLTKENKRICAVGDDAQSIYSFRGANVDNILNFNEVYDGSVRIMLRNYRSTQRIVQAANSLIKHNERQIKKETYSEKLQGDRLVFKPAYSDKEEAIIVCNEIQRIKRNDNCEYDDFAILYRANSLSRSFEEALRKDNIPYRIYGGLSFYQRKEIKDIIAYFRLVVNPDDEEAFKRIINYPARGIGCTTVSKISAQAMEYGVSLWKVTCEPMKYGLNVNNGTLSKLYKFRELMKTFMERADTDDAYTLGCDIIKQSGVSADLYSDASPEAVARQENLDEFLGSMQEFVESRREEDRGNEVKLSNFLQEVSLLTDLDSDDEEDARRVTLMTIHSAKGLEFPTVFIVGLEENIFPSPMCVNSRRELEEERRLLYVAITRAEKHCIMTCAKNRFRYGRVEFDTPSRFLRDIDPALMHVEKEAAGMSETSYSRSLFGSYGDSRRWQNSNPVASQFKADPKPRQAAHREEMPKDPFSAGFKHKIQAAGGNMARISDVISKTSSPYQAISSSQTSAGISVGDVIEHSRFGIGEVLCIEGSGENTKAKVKFRNAGEKQLLLKFAKFKKL